VNQTSTFDQRLEIIKIRLWEIGQVFAEIGKGFARKDPMLFRTFMMSLTFALAILFEADVWFLKKINCWHFYPADGLVFRFYVFAAIWGPILFYGLRVRNQKKEFAKNLKEVYDLVGLKNAIGSYPNFLSLEPITGGTMKLRLTNGSFTLAEWQKRKERLEANMHVFVDEIRQVPDKGIIEMTFSYEPMPTKVSIENLRGYRNYTFLMGRDRSKSYLGDFADNPHFLVAGETGGGKSAFLRQLIITIKINQPEAEFHLVDLKGGVEFGYLTNLPGVEVISEVSQVATALDIVSGLISERIQKLKKQNMNDIKQFFASDDFRRMTVAEKRKHVLGRRVFVVVDECAEIFLFGLGHEPAATRKIRGSMSRITRLGRSVGVHVVLATQRPDKNAVDPQVKTNLTSTICYRVHDHGASLAILGTGRATDLPKIPGRAVMHRGSEEIEIQTPFLDFAESKKLLEDAFKINLDANSSQSTESHARATGGSDAESAQPDSV
jgi:FtsK/SpoIIIE family